MRSMVEGRSGQVKLPLHRSPSGPPPRASSGRMSNANDAGGRNLAGQRVPKDSIDVMSVKTGRPLRDRAAKVKV